MSLGEFEISGLKREIATLTARLRDAERENATLRQCVNDTAYEMECLPGCDSLAHEELCPVTNTTVAWRTLVSRLRDAERERDRARDACLKMNDDVCQALGKVLGYPWYKDDPGNFPDATEADGVCVGEHVAESIAAEAASRLAAARERCAAVEGALEMVKGIVLLAATHARQGATMAHPAPIDCLVQIEMDLRELLALLALVRPAPPTEAGG